MVGGMQGVGSSNRRSRRIFSSRISGKSLSSNESFRDVLEAEVTTPEDAVLALLKQLEHHEQDLQEMPSHGNFFAYKNQVRALTNQILKEGYRLKSFKDRNDRNFEVVQIIDKKLADIYSALLRRNPEVRFILRTMGEIRGLLLDELR